MTTQHRVGPGVPSGGEFRDHQRDADTLVLDDGGPINPVWNWSVADSTEFARRHLRALCASLRAADAADHEWHAHRHLGEAAAHAEVAVSIISDSRELPLTFGYLAARMVETQRARPWIGEAGTFRAPAMSAERRTELLEHFALRFAAVSEWHEGGSAAEAAAWGARDGYWSALHLMAPAGSREALEDRVAMGERGGRTLALVVAGLA